MRSKLFLGKSTFTEKPISPDPSKKINLVRGIKKEEEKQVEEFINENNQALSGVFTLLNYDDLENFQKLSYYPVLMKRNEKLLGTVFSFPFPVKIIEFKNESDDVKGREIKEEIFGYTTFLNVHEKLRGYGLCMELIKELTNWGYENQIYMGYQMTNFPLTDKATKINNWYRPLNLLNTISLGFTFPGFNEINRFHEYRISYSCKSPKGFNSLVVRKSDVSKILNFLKSIEMNDSNFSNKEDKQEKKGIYLNFNFDFLNQWIQIFPSYFIINKENKEIVGFFSYKCVKCKTPLQQQALICLPLLFVSNKNYELTCLQSLFYIAFQQSYDIVYLYETGYISAEILKAASCVISEKSSYFSLYNNDLSFAPSDIFLPFF
jgi:hypothetical protein